MDRISWTIEQIRSRFPDKFAAQEAPERKTGAHASNGHAAASNGHASNGHASHAARTLPSGTTFYGRRALDLEIAKLATASDGLRNNTLNETTFAVYQLVAGGEIDDAEAEAAIRSTAQSIGLDESEINKTFRSAAESGKKQPRSAPERAADVIDAPPIPGFDDDRPSPSSSHPQRSPTSSAPPGVIEEDQDPHKLARECRVRIERTTPNALRHWREEWYVWRDGYYQHQTRGDIHGLVTRFTKQQSNELAQLKLAAYAKLDDDKKKDPPKAFPVTQRLIGDVLNALRSIAQLGSRFEAPGWIAGHAPADVPRNADYIPCQNGLLAMPRAGANGEPTLLPHTQEYFCFGRLGFDYDASAPPPYEWLAFLSSLWPEDKTCIEALQEWMGYLLTSDTSAQKILLLIGPPRSGKGTILKVIQALAGPDNCAGTSLTSLAGPFGLAGLVGKSIAMVTDARLSNKADASVALERLLSVSGEDMVPINRKSRDEITAKLSARFVLATNELPKFVDASSAITSRFVVIPFTESFLGREDTLLFERISREFPGIFRWALEGLRRFRARGRFEQPEAAREHFADWAEIVSPVAAFVTERCILGRDLTVRRDDLYKAWRDWCEATGRHSTSISHFGRDLSAAFGKRVRHYRPHDDSGSRVNEYVGIRLRHIDEFGHGNSESGQGKIDQELSDEMARGFSSPVR